MQHPKVIAADGAAVGAGLAAFFHWLPEHVNEIAGLLSATWIVVQMIVGAYRLWKWLQK